DLLHVVQAPDRPDLHADEGPPTGAVLRLPINPDIAHAVPDKGKIRMDQARDHDLPLLAVLHVLACPGIDDLDIESRFDVVHHAGMGTGADAMLAGIHMIDAGLCRAIVIEDRAAPELLLIFEPGIAGAFAAGEQCARSMQPAARSPNRGKMADIGCRADD